MSSIPKKLFWMLGYNNLSIILEQERRHWLLKTDKNKHVQDKLTGDMFQGQIDNIGSDVVIESQKLPYKYTITSSIKFREDAANDILSINNSAFPHSAAVNGLMFTRIVSTNYAYGNDDINHYKIIFKNAKKCILPFGASSSSNEVYADRWIKTSTVPEIKILNRNTGEYSITGDIRFIDDITNIVWYYPLSETLQPLGLTDKGGGVYEMDAVNDDGYIGYPLFWFTCDQTNIGSNLTFGANNINRDGEQIFFVSNEGNASPYDAKVYTGVDGILDATPDGLLTTKYIIKCVAKISNPFSGDPSDFDKELDPTCISLVNKESHVETPIEFICGDGDKITMNIINEEHTPWEWDSTNNVYKIEMSYFDRNCIAVTASSPLIAIFNVYFDQSIPFVQRSTDVGMAGIRLGSANPNSDVYERYPYNINKWSGLPDWLNNLDEGLVPEHAVMYAFHQPPTYDPENPETMQGAGLIIDPGKHATDDSETVSNDSIGRVYVLSNDDIEYKNNLTTENPKPARTAARICDIPTSVLALSGATNSSQDPIVDKKYVRTEAPLKNDDLDRIYNRNSTRWVRPTALTIEGMSVYEKYERDNMFAFYSINELDDVDMYNHNNFRKWMNLNPMVDSSKVHVNYIAKGGNGYAINDTGVCIVGGFVFEYHVQEVGTNGSVQRVAILPPAEPGSMEPKMIALSNFDMNHEEGSGITYPYGTSRTSGEGAGLKISLMIEGEYYSSIIPYKGEFFEDLFAFVRENDGGYVYEYRIDASSSKTPKPGTWIKTLKISEFEITSYIKAYGGLSTHEAFINSILPSVRELNTTMKTDGLDEQTLKVAQTASFLNIIDNEKSPVVPDMSSDDPTSLENIVDLTKFYCSRIGILTAENRYGNTNSDAEEVIRKVKEVGLDRYDCYLLWRWVEATDPNDKRFEFGIVHHGFINQMTDDRNTMLPSTELFHDNYVHTNPGTTMIWNVPGVGTMVWIYDQTYDMKENYYIDPETMDLHVERIPMNYDKIDVHLDNRGLKELIVDADNRLLWNVITNTNMKILPQDEVPIYQQTKMYQTRSATIGTLIDGIANDERPRGNWRLVLPRIDSYRLSSDTSSQQFIPKKLEIIRATVGSSDDITNVNGDVINTKFLVMDSSEGGAVRFKAYNRATRSWETI